MQADEGFGEAQDMILYKYNEKTPAHACFSDLADVRGKRVLSVQCSR